MGGADRKSCSSHDPLPDMPTEPYALCSLSPSGDPKVVPVGERAGVRGPSCERMSLEACFDLPIAQEWHLIPASPSLLKAEHIPVLYPRAR
jgi:hypothetical protein